jgi:hypothetical protein
MYFSSRDFDLSAYEAYAGVAKKLSKIPKFE